MPDLKRIYQTQAGQYQRLVDHEDYQGNLLPAIQAIMPLEGRDIVETGAGTGRLTELMARRARSLRAFDLSAHMLQTARGRMDALDLRQVRLAVADHRGLPVAEASADLVISGWSVCYVALDSGPEWRAVLSRTLADYQRCLRPGGKVILIETLGTGRQQPQRIPVLREYLDYLDEIGFKMDWVRTDFCFEDVQQAQELVQFFFGEEMLANLQGLILPECTGLWWLEK